MGVRYRDDMSGGVGHIDTVKDIGVREDSEVGETCQGRKIQICVLILEKKP